jgi:peptidoglycan hydrolase-like protein with peptidoglycan-binding domain
MGTSIIDAISGFTIWKAGLHNTLIPNDSNLGDFDMKKYLSLGIAIGALVIAPLALAGNGTMTPAPKPMMHKMMHHKMSMAQRRAWLKKVQMALNHHGAMLKADGMWGPKTMMAIKSFQMKNGLKATGHLNHMTLVKLGLMKGWSHKKGWHKK